MKRINNNLSQQMGKILVFSAASGAGKTTILNYLQKKFSNLVYSISATTRLPRIDEKDRIHYYFLSENEFRKMVKNNEFAEWAKVHGNYYGTPKKFIDTTIQSGKHVIMDIDVYGKILFDKSYPQAIGIFIKPPSLNELRKRLCQRNTDSEDVITLRVSNAEKEITFACENGTYEYNIVNDDLDKTLVAVEDLVRKIIH